MTDLKQFATIAPDLARQMCSDIVGYVQASQNDPVLYQMVVDLQNVLDAPPVVDDSTDDPWADDVDLTACPENCPRCSGKE